jgi:Nif-specific regulatory protein
MMRITKMPIHRDTVTKEDFNLFCEISTSVHAILELEDMLNHILEKVKEALNIEGASVALHDPNQNQFYFIRTIEAAKDSDNKRMKRLRFPDHMGVAGWVLREKKTVIIPDVSKDDRFFTGIDRQENHITRNMICIPLVTRKSLIGVLYAINKLNGAFTKKDAWLLEILSGTIAIAIENAKFCGDLKQHARSLTQENIRLKSELQDRFNLQGIIGSSAAMRKVFHLMDKVISTPISVLIQGETGTGKELVAKAIHYNGHKKDKPFVAENCGAISENLLESELFGHVKGAFTGAIADKKGIIELANGGTVFLDEIEEMSPAMQVKLLRVFQEGCLRPVGSSETVEVDVRLISSTNRNLKLEVQKGNFREDLFYRINVFKIEIPPLRERKEDIPLLVDFFSKRIAEKFKRPAARVSPQALSLLMLYDWPGNVRELQNEIQRALTLAGDDGEIRIAHLSDKISSDAIAGAATYSHTATLPEVIIQIERQMIIDALRTTAGNRSQAARKLGLTRQGLLNKINRYQLMQ